MSDGDAPLTRTEPRLPEGLPAGHTCRCSACETTLARSRHRRHARHLSPCFGDGYWTSGLVVFLDGETVNGRCYEAEQGGDGADGYVLLYVDPPHRCQRCGRDRCAERRTGEVTYARDAVPYDPTTRQPY